VKSVAKREIRIEKIKPGRGSFSKMGKSPFYKCGTGQTTAGKGGN